MLDRALDVPILVQGYPDELDRLEPASRRDAFCGKISVCNNLRQYGIKYSLTRLHTVHPESDDFKADLQEDLGQALAAELGDAAVFSACNVTREEDIAAAIEVAQREFGPLTGMVNNAGIVGAIGSIMDTSAESFDHTMSILSRAVFLGIKHAALAMQPHGRGAIVSLASTAGVVGGLGPHVYTMAKHGVVGITKVKQEVFPAFDLDMIQISVAYPGASPTETEQGIVLAIEEAVRGLDGVFSRSGVANSCRHAQWLPSLTFEW